MTKGQIETTASRHGTRGY